MIAALPPCPGSFEHLHASLSTESNAAFGTQFEELADWALWNSADWGPKIAKLQHWSAWAREQNAAARKKVYLEQDTGADRVITTVDGQTVIVQHKGFHDPDERVKMKDANNTLVLAETANADMVLFVTSGAGLTSNTAHNIKRLPFPVITLDRSWLRHVPDYPHTHTALLRELTILDPGYRRKPRRLPLRPHQIEAVEAVGRALRTNREVQLLAACGFGKTVTSHAIAERLHAHTVLVLLPTLSLMRQTIRQYKDQTAEHGINAVAVCSDSSVGSNLGLLNEDEVDLHAPIIRDADVLADWMANNPGTAKRPTVVFSTYHSIATIIRAQHRHGMDAFDYCWADEAHHLVGSGKDGAALGELVKRKGDTRHRLRAHSRVYATATPKQHTDKTKWQASKLGMTLLDSLGPDSATFGPIAYAMGTGRAIDEGILAPYHLNVIAVRTESKLADQINHRVYVDSESGIWNAQMFAAVEALAQSYASGYRRFLIYFNRIRNARRFAELVEADPRLPGAALVEGSQRAAVREEILGRLDEQANPDGYVVCSAKTIGEGVDVPALDAVMFADPRASEVDILQACGRAMRRSPGKTHAAIIVPVAIACDDPDGTPLTVEQIMDVEGASAFGMTFEVLRALMSDDPYLVQWLKAPKFGDGARSGQGPRQTNEPAPDDVDRPDRTHDDGEEFPEAPDRGLDNGDLNDREPYTPDATDRRVNVLGAGLGEEFLTVLREQMRVATIRMSRTPRTSDEEKLIRALVTSGFTYASSELFTEKMFAAQYRGDTLEQLKDLVEVLRSELVPA